MVITQSEFMRRMKDMSQMQGGVSFYGDLPDNLTLVVNIVHPLVKKIIDSKDKKLGSKLEIANDGISKKKSEIEVVKKEELNKEKQKSNEEEDQLSSLNDELAKLEESKRKLLTDFGKKNKLAKQLIDLALLANGMLKGADLDKFIKRSVELIKK
jgi:molecular chaperone HtpG